MYQTQVKRILNQLRGIAKNSKNKKDVYYLFRTQKKNFILYGTRV